MLVLPLEGVVILADIRKTIGPLPQSICYPSGDPAVLRKGSSAFLIVHLTFSWPLSFVSSWTPATMQWWFCLPGKPPKQSFQLHRCRCLKLRWQVAQFLPKSLHPRRLRNTCKSATVFQVSWIAVRKENCFLNSMLLDTWAEFEFPTVHHAMPWEILLQFVSPLLIGPIGTDLCAFPQQFCVFVMFSIFSLAQSACATWRGVAMSDMSRKNCERMEFVWDICPFIRKPKKRRQRCRRRCSKTCLWNLLRSVNEYELEPGHLPDFLSVHLLFGWAKVQGSPCTNFLVNWLWSWIQIQIP